jgi:Zn-dependent protease with chaperone function
MIGLVQDVFLVADNHGLYYSELQALKKAPDTRLIFDKDAHVLLASIEQDLGIYKNLTWLQRCVRSSFLAFDVVVVTAETMPQLYAYIDGICEKAQIVTPTVFITRKTNIFNAFAKKLLMSTGAIVVGKKLIKELSDNAIEAVIAHEIGHIKYEHSNKTLALSVLQSMIFYMIFEKLNIHSGITSSDEPHVKSLKNSFYLGKISILYYLVSHIVPLIINKRFEKEADEFAYKVNGKGKGLIEFFELLLQKDRLREEEFVSVYSLLQANRRTISPTDYCRLIFRYYVARVGHLYSNFNKKIYHDTFVGEHPSPEVRIATVKKYMGIYE